MNPALDRKTFRIGADHPCLIGHFPGAPTVPAVVILDEVLSAAELERPGVLVESLVQAKFMRPLPPDAEATVSIDWHENGLSFNVACGEDTIAVGTFRIGAGASP